MPCTIATTYGARARFGATGRPARSQLAAEALSGSHDVVEVAGERVDEQPPGHRQVILVAVERQAGERVGVGRGTGQVAGGQVDLGGHEIAVSELEPGERPDRERVEQLEPPPGGPHRLRDVVVGEVGGRQPVQGGAVHYAVTGLARRARPLVAGRRLRAGGTHATASAARASGEPSDRARASAISASASAGECWVAMIPGARLMYIAIVARSRAAPARSPAVNAASAAIRNSRSASSPAKRLAAAPAACLSKAARSVAVAASSAPCS